MDDIVTRLREYEAITDNAYVINALVAAADEIERLRTNEYQASIADLRQSLERAQRARAIWEGVANLLNADLKDELRPAEYATRYGRSALSTLYAIVEETER